MALTDKQCAVILVRNWIQGSVHPAYLDKEEVEALLDYRKSMSEERFNRIIEAAKKIIAPFEERIDDLYANIKNWS